MNDLAQFQDEFGQLPFFKCYTQLCIGFPIDNSSESEIVTALETAATKLLQTFPWLAGQVINEGSGPGSSGTFKIVPYEKPQKNPPVIVKRIPDLDFAELVKKKAPASMLDGSVLAARHGVPVSYDTADGPAEVFSLQANFIKGGLILTFSGNHNAMDMNGQGHLISLFAKVLQGEALSEEEIKEGNRDRRNIIPLLKDDEPLLDHTMMIVDPAAAHPDMHDASWVYYRFSKPTLDELKQQAMSSVSNGVRLSSNDIVSAFFWQRVSAARQARLSPDQRTQMCRAANGRRFLDPPLSPAYMGDCVTATFNSYTLKEIDKLPIGDIAMTLRNDLLSIDSYAVRSLTTLISRTKDKNMITYGARLDLGSDVVMSSWAHQQTQSLEFGLLGKPAFVRRQKFAPMESLCYLMPRTREGDIDVAACLREEDIVALGKDELWTRYVEYIG